MPSQNPTSASFIKRDWLRVSGPDARRFLNGLFTADLKRAAAPAAGATLLLDAKGHLLFAARYLCLSDQDFVLSFPAGEGEAARAHIDRYLIADQVELSELSTDMFEVAALTQSPLSPPLAELELRPITPSALDKVYRAPESPWGWRIGLGLNGTAYEEWWRKPGQSWPVELREQSERELLEWRLATGTQRWGVDWKQGSFVLEYPAQSVVSLGKGCFLGQEPVARGIYRGKAVKGFSRVSASAELAPGPVYVEGESAPVGELTTVLGRQGLGVLRVAALADATRLRAAGKDGQPVAIETAELLLRDLKP